MSMLRRLFGGGGGASKGGAGAAPRDSGPVDETERDRALAAEDAARLADELLARQLRYADRKWTPPAQGGRRRADDPERADDDT